MSKEIRDHLLVNSLIRSYQVRQWGEGGGDGSVSLRTMSVVDVVSLCPTVSPAQIRAHNAANQDPLGITRPKKTSDLIPAERGFSESALGMCVGRGVLGMCVGRGVLGMCAHPFTCSLRTSPHVSSCLFCVQLRLI